MKVAENRTFKSIVGKSSKLALVAATGVALGLSGIADAEAQDRRVRWQVPTGFPTSLPGLDTIVPVSKWLETMTGGNIQLRYAEPGQLVPPFEILGAVSQGRFDAGFTWIGYDAGTIPALPLFGAMPFGMEPWAFTAWNYHGGGAELLNELYAPHGVVGLLCGIVGPEAAGWFRNPINSLGDFKDLRIRFAGIGGEVLRELGASVTMIPGGEVYQALERGVIDAAEFSQPAIDQKLGFQQVIKNYLLPGWHQTFTTTHLLVNKKSWDALSAAQQQTIETACMAGTMYTLARSEYIQGDAIAEFEKAGVNAQQLPLDVLRELKTVTDKVFDRLGEADADFKRVLASQREFEQRYQVWRELGYLPRDFK
ncbi:MAG TPA: TRAP transporter substrate-binding protein [Rhodocyclaceae bacterium]|jgi:TRAP-type mannitol/chloroaromatic compound transport system substrate-binding protein|nr:TRAP transporter substrate-binding protein [Rhodocyclaceae bacterium]HRQ47228.1 TRAP transporter substrate-binding protein [Rhodocyclaceae bacterium]